MWNITACLKAGLPARFKIYSKTTVPIAPPLFSFQNIFPKLLYQILQVSEVETNCKSHDSDKYVTKRRG